MEIRRGKRVRTLGLIAVFLGCALLTGCMSMALPVRLQQSQIPVETSGGFFADLHYSFGGWSVNRVDRSAITEDLETENSAWGAEFHLSKENEYRFILEQNMEPKYRVNCALHYASKGFEVRSMTVYDDSMLLMCDIEDVETEAEVGILQCQMGREGPIGYATFGEDNLRIDADFTGTTASFIRPPTAYGYVVNVETKPVAAIQLTHDRFIWMHDSLKDELQSPTAALLMAMAYSINLEPKAGEPH